MAPQRVGELDVAASFSQSLSSRFCPDCIVFGHSFGDLCGLLVGGYEVTAAKLTVNLSVSIKMACDPALMDADSLPERWHETL